MLTYGKLRALRPVLRVMSGEEHQFFSGLSGLSCMQAFSSLEVGIGSVAKISDL